MKSYPKTYGFDQNLVGKPCWAFYKYDGSNLRFEFNKKQKQWCKFGTRHRLFDESDPDYGTAIEIFRNKYAEPLAKIFTDTWKNAEYFIAYVEFLGPNSFCGKHKPEDVKDVVLFDVNVHKRGLIGPEEFLKAFGDLHIAELIYQGKFTEEFFSDVRNGKYEVNEGVMCKGGSGHKLWMCKIKTLDYLKRLKEYYGEDWDQFWE